METGVPYARMPEEHEAAPSAGSPQTAAVQQPTVIMAAPTQQTYMSYSGKGNIILGTFQIILGTIIVILAVILLGVESPLSAVAHGIWCGVIIGLSGTFQVVAGQTKTKCWIVTSLVFCILAAVFVIPILVVSSLDIAVSVSNEEDYYKYYYSEAEDWKTYYAVNGVQLCAAFAEGIIAIVSSVLACMPLCCQSPAGAQQVQYVTSNQAGQVIMLTPIQTNQALTQHQQVVAVPVGMQPGYTAPVLTPTGAPPMYTTVPAALAAPVRQTQPAPVQVVQQAGNQEKGPLA